jgi:phosphoglycolate phosphatase-like HAD superfamily hydrolase
MARRGRHAVVLFDLDGTLVDSAPDLAGAANELRAARGLAPLPFERLRPMVGTGARGMVGTALGVKPGDDGFEALRDEFLALYERRLLRETAVFAAIEPVLQRLEASALPWGIVTNKALRLATPLVEGLALHTRAAVLSPPISTAAREAASGAAAGGGAPPRRGARGLCLRRRRPS